MEKTETNQMKVRRVFEENDRELSYTEISEKSGVDTNHLWRYLNTLVKMNLIEKFGKGRATRYKSINIEQCTESLESKVFSICDQPKIKYNYIRLAEIVNNAPNKRIARSDCVKLHGFKNKTLSSYAAKAKAKNLITTYRYRGQVYYKAPDVEIPTEIANNRNKSDYNVKLDRVPVLKKFLDWLIKALRKKPYTAYMYGHNILQFLSFKSSRGFNPIPVENITQQYVDDYLESLHKYENITQTAKMAAVRRFWKYLFKKGYVKKDFTDDFEYPPIPEKIQPDLTKKEFNLMLEQAQNFRDKVILEFLVFEGMRVSEVASRNLKHVDFKNRHILVEGNKAKGRRNRLIPISAKFIPVLQDYINNFRFSIDKEEPLFTTDGGRRIRKNTIQKTISRMRKAAGITKKITPHSCRRACARWLYERGLDILAIQYILGHKNLNQTQKYINLTQQFTDKAYSSSMDEIINDLEVVEHAKQIITIESTINEES
ncbi:MAG: tyrosine-type recombinase/integrase [Promethearchaeota archaeon]